jgi:uncharacterized membrane protein SirB2
MPTWLTTIIITLRCLACVGLVVCVGFAVATGSAQWFVGSILLVALYFTHPAARPSIPDVLRARDKN